MSKHTPGPWKIAVKNNPYYGICTVYNTELGWVEIYAPNGGDPDNYRAENSANARLIAAAPDLLEACRFFVEWLDRESAGFDHKTHNRETPEGETAWREWFYGNIALCDAAQNAARVAISKAEGT